MKKNKVLCLFILVIFLPLFSEENGIFAKKFYMPFSTNNRNKFSWSYVTQSGNFAVWRKPYKGIKGHYHAGLDFKNPGKRKGAVEAVYASAKGVVYSLHKNGPSSFVMIKHNLEGNRTIYSVYTHINDIVVSVGDTVDYTSVIGSFIDKKGLDKWGEYLNHIHFEILKTAPKFIGNENGHPVYSSYSIDCISRFDLYDKFYNPELFFEK